MELYLTCLLGLSVFDFSPPFDTLPFEWLSEMYLLYIILIRSYCEFPLEWEPSPLNWLLLDLLLVSSILEGRLLLIRDRGVLLILRPWALGACSINCIWCLLGMIAPRFLDPVCEEIYFANFASLILVYFFCSIGWFCRISMRALLITFLTGWVDVFLIPSFVLITSFYDPLGRASNLLWDARVLF